MTAEALELLIDSHLKTLALPSIRGSYRSLAREADAEGKGVLVFLEALLAQEVNHRQERRLARRLQEARFPVPKGLDTFDFTVLPHLDKPKVLALARSEFVAARENVIFLGNPGTGKSHLAIALGAEAVRNGFRVRFVTAAALADELEAAQAEHRVSKVLKAWSRYHLVIVDELGYVPFAEARGQLMFQFFAERYERGAVLLTSNLEFSEWTGVLGEERMTAALVDRLTHRAHIFVVNGESYRLRESLTRR
jgi:DNA replication protein DnaC